MSTTPGGYGIVLPDGGSILINYDTGTVLVLDKIHAIDKIHTHGGDTKS